MGTFIEIGEGLKALEIKGRGVVLTSKSNTLFLDYVAILDGELVDADVGVQSGSARPVKPGPSSIASVNIEAFEKEVSRRNLTPAGEYGAVGPLVGKLRDALKLAGEGSPTANLLGNLLALGDHAKFGSAAAVVGMPAALQEEFATVLEAGETADLESFVDKCAVAL